MYLYKRLIKILSQKPNKKAVVNSTVFIFCFLVTNDKLL